MSRIAVLVLVGVLTAAAGCGGGSSSAVTTQDTQPKSAPAGTTGSVGPGLPTAPADPYLMDPSQHQLPPGPVAGRLEGRAFTPDRVEFTDQSVVFRQGKDFFPDLEIKVALRAENAKPLLPAKVTVNPAQKWTDANLPTIATAVRSGTELPRNVMMTDGYALTLELGPRDKGKVRGKIYLCLPDATKSYLTGTFEAEWVRDFTSPPDAEDVPFIQGKVKHSAPKDTMLTVGYAGLTSAGDAITDSAGLQVGSEGAVQSSTFKPRLATTREDKSGFLYDFTKLPPGQFVVFVRQKDGPITWQKIEVKADGQHTLDLTLEAANSGTVEVKVPADFKGGLRLAPHDFGFPDPNDLVSTNLGFALDLQAEPKEGKATFRNVPPGKYAIFPASGTIARLGTVEVAMGKTSIVELTPVKK